MSVSRDDRGVMGLGRFTVPDDHPELVEFLYQATRSFGSAVPVFADWLRDRDDGRADLVADLTAPGVVPDFAPGPGDEIPLAAGREWGAVRRANGVRGRVYPGTELAAAIRAATGVPDVGGWDESPYRFGHRLSADRQTPARLGSALDCCRGRFLFPLFGLNRQRVIALHSLRASRGVADVPYLLSFLVAPAVGARWLREVKSSDPVRFRALVKDDLMSYVLTKPAFAEFVGKADHAVGPSTSAP